MDRSADLAGYHFPREDLIIAKIPADIGVGEEHVETIEILIRHWP